MSAKHQSWGWMLAVDFFFAGMGGGMLLVAGLIELFVGSNQLSLLGNIVGPLCMCVGCGFLILELGRPLQAWRVFMNPKAILTCGAWIMSIAIVAGLVYASYGLNPAWFGMDKLFWQEWGTLRKLLAVVCVLTGLVVATYPGVLLGRHKGRPFWVGPGIMTLFMLSSVVTGVAGHIICGMILPPVEMPGAWNHLPALAGGLLFFQLVSWIGYLWIKRTGTSAAEAASALKWLQGKYADTFKSVVMFMGTIVPLVLVMIPSPLCVGIGALLVLVGGVVMRCLVVYAGEDRTWLPGEQKYRGRLPLGNEAFLKAWSK